MSESPTTYGLPKKREQVIEELRLAYTNQNLEDQEYERRLNEAMNAQSIEDLKRVIIDFPVNIKAKVFPSSNALELNSIPASHYPAQTQEKMQVILGSDNRNLPELSSSVANISAILSTQKLDFRLSQVPDTPILLRVECILSSTTLDLRNENLSGKHIDLRVNGILGDIKILLPRGVKIHRNIQMVAGEFKVRDKQRGWISRLRGKLSPGEEEEDEGINLSLSISGNYWLGNIKIVY